MADNARAVMLLREGRIQLDGHNDIAEKLRHIIDELIAREAQEARRLGPSAVRASVEPTPAAQISRLESIARGVSGFLDEWLIGARLVADQMESAARTNSEAADRMASAAVQMREAAGTMYMAKPQ